MRKVVLIVLSLTLAGCITGAPQGWDNAEVSVIDQVTNETEQMLKNATVEDRDFLLTIGKVAGAAYDASALSMKTKSLRMLYAIQSANRFAKLLKEKKEPLKVLRANYTVKASDSELWMGFIIHQVHALRLEKNNPPG